MAFRLIGFLVLVVAAVERVEGMWSYFCQIDDVAGVWTLQRDLDTSDDFKHCWSHSSSTLDHTIRLSEPDLAEDEYGNYGHWTLIYGISIEITIHGRKYYTYFPWSYNWHTGWKIDCNSLESGTSHDILTNNYACFGGEKSYSANGTKIDHNKKPKPAEADPTPPTLLNLVQDKTTPTPHPPTFLVNDPTPTNVPRALHFSGNSDKKKSTKKFKIDYELINRINDNDLRLWEAEAYEYLEDIKEEDLIMMAGGNMSLRARPPKPAPVTEEQLLKVKAYPRSFDWRNVNGVNYVTSVRNQGHCGSCYAFAATAAYESRVRIMTKNTVQPVLSPQDVVNCNPYTYGCWGGWIFTEGKYAEEFGFVEESCNIYNAQTERCERDSTCQKYYGTNYQYIGGYFGGSNEILMMEAIFNNGPIVVGFAVYHDFWYYRRGVYYHSGPDWLMGFHAVIVVGWGQDERSGTKYWIVKNSWGKQWGEDGYFRIARGNNDCDIEAESFEAFPIL